MVARWLLVLGFLTGCGGVVSLDDLAIGADGGAANGSGPNGASGTPGTGTGSVGSGSTPGSPGSPGTAGPGTPTAIPDASAPPPVLTLSCGETTCTAGSQSCCVDQFGGAACVAKGAPCQGFPLDCTSGASCPSGQVCCLEFQSQSASCQSTCGGPTGGPGPGPGPGGGIVLCDSDAECPKGERCREAPGDVGIKFCRPRRGGGGGGGGSGGGFGGN